MTPPKVVTQQNTNSNSLKGAWPHANATRWREEKGPQVNQGTPSIQMLEIPERARHTEVKNRYGVSGYRFLTHADGVRPTQGPDLQTAVTHPLSQDTMAVVGGPPVCEQARTLGPPGILERSVGSISSPHNCSWEVRPLLFSLWYHIIIWSLVWKLVLEVSTLPWFWQALSFWSH